MISVTDDVNTDTEKKKHQDGRVDEEGLVLASLWHTYPLLGSFTPQVALLPQYARLPRRVPMHAARAFARVTGVLGGGEHPWAPVSRLRV